MPKKPKNNSPEFPKRPPSKPGAAKKLTPERKEKILELLRAGNYIETTAKACGLCSMSIHRWIRSGREISERIEENKQDPKTLNKTDKWYLAFYYDVVQAQAEAETSLVATIKTAAKDNWVAAMTMLERKHPEHWGRRDKIEYTGETKNTVAMDFKGLSLEELRSLAKLTPDDKSAGTSQPTDS